MPDTGTIGWKGYMKLSSSDVGSGKLLPFTTCDLSESVNPIMSDGIHGGGVSEVNGVFGSRHNMAIGQANYTGSVNGEVFGGTGQYASAFRILLDSAIGRSSADHTQRLMGFTESYPMVFAPAGEDAWQYPSNTVTNRKTGATATLTTPVKAVVGTFALNGNMGGNITYTAGITATSRRKVTATKPTTSDFTYESVSNLDDSNPIPYWSSAFSVTGTGETFGGGGFTLADLITAWTININNNAQPVFTFNGNNVATDVVQGLMEVSGSFSYYSPNGLFTEYLNNGAVLSLTLGSITVNIPYMFLTTYPIPNTGLNGVVVRNVDFQGLAYNNLASIYTT